MSARLLVNRYRLESCIAIGGMGEVWRGWDLARSRAVAVKLLRGRYAQDAAAVARFRAEARCAGRLSHPGVVKIYGSGEADRPFLVMELVNGSSLAQVLARGPLKVRQTLDVIAQAAVALQAAHEGGIVHRDIKPANLLIGPDGEVKLADFGIAHSDDVETTCSGATSSGAASSGGAEVVLGTAAYLAPERVIGEPATVSSDLYSLGVVMFECLTGTRPFTGTMTEIALAHQHRELPTLPATIPAPVRALAERLTSKNPNARPGSAAMVGAEAAILREDFGAAARGQSWRDPQKRAPAGWLPAARLPAAETLVDCPVSSAA